MRYRIGTDPETALPSLDAGLFAGISVFGLLLGIGFVVVGIRVRQMWMTFWGAGLTIASIAYLGAVVLGIA